jgi:hypothetical protein
MYTIKNFLQLCQYHHNPILEHFTSEKITHEFTGSQY